MKSSYGRINSINRPCGLGSMAVLQVGLGCSASRHSTEPAGTAKKDQPRRGDISKTEPASPGDRSDMRVRRTKALRRDEGVSERAQVLLNPTGRGIG